MPFAWGASPLQSYPGIASGCLTAESYQSLSKLVNHVAQTMSSLKKKLFTRLDKLREMG